MEPVANIDKFLTLQALFIALSGVQYDILLHPATT